MFTIPAAELGTNSIVYVVPSLGGDREMVIRGVGGTTYVKIPAPLTTVGQLKLWVGGVNAMDLDTVYLPQAEYAAVEADWLRQNSQPASAFQIGDCVIWMPTAINPIPTHNLVAGGQYYIIGCVFQGPPACWSLANTPGGQLVSVADEDELTIVIQPSAQLSLFGNGTVRGYPETSKPHAAKRCECGATKCKSNIHSPWCPMA